MRNSTRRKRNPNSGSGEDGQMAHKKISLPKGAREHSQD